MKEAAPNRSPLSTPTMDPATMSASPAGATTHHDKLHSPEPLGDVATPPPPVHHPAQAPNFPPSVGSPATQEMESSGWVADRTRRGGMTPEPNPYVAPSPAAPPTSYKDTIETVKSVFTRWRQKIGESAKMAEDLSRNTWQHLNTGPSFTEAAMGRIAQGTKVIAEGGYENIFRQTFETLPEEQLRKSYACYLSTSAGPVMGILYLSSAKLAFCSDNPLPYKAENKTEWSHYKVIIPLHQLRACNPSISSTNSAEKYIQIVSVDNHEFWFMSFVNYSDAVQNLEETMQQVRRSAI